MKISFPYPKLPANSGAVRRRAALCCAMVVLLPVFSFAQDVASLPDYKPQKPVSGVIRSWGSNHMGSMMKAWEQGFRRFHPNVWFEDTLKGTATAQFGLHVNVADLALSGRQIFPYEFYGIYRRSQMYPVEIAVATGSYDVQGKSTAIGVFVHKDNPLSKLNLGQLDAIFGAQRTGGWQAIEWNTDAARSDKGNIRTWGQLGLTGEWADKPIHVYGPPGLYPGGVSFFQNRVMGGGDTWNEDLREYDDRKRMMQDLGADRYGIGYTAMTHRTDRVKPLALAEQPGGPDVVPTRSSVANRTYPLARFAYIYIAPDTPTGDAADPKVDPKIKEFLRYILSRQGQQAVGRDGSYFPLTLEVARAQLKKLD